MNNMINSVVELMTTMMLVSMGRGMISPVMLQTRKPGEPKSEAERRATHKAKYGTEKLPPRGTGLGTLGLQTGRGYDIAKADSRISELHNMSDRYSELSVAGKDHDTCRASGYPKGARAKFLDRQNGTIHIFCRLE